MSEMDSNHIIPRRRDRLMLVIAWLVVYSLLIWEGLRLVLILTDESTEDTLRGLVILWIGLLSIFSVLNRWGWRPIWRKMAEATSLNYKSEKHGFLGLKGDAWIEGRYRGYAIAIRVVKRERGICTNISIHLETIDRMWLSFRNQPTKVGAWFEMLKNGKRKPLPLPVADPDFNRQFELMDNTHPELAARLLSGHLTRQGWLEIARQSRIECELTSAYLQFFQEGVIYDRRYFKAILDFLINFAISAERLKLYA